MSKKSKRKGNGYEIKISRILTKWYCDFFIRKRNTKEDWFWRTAGSGAKSTRTRSARTSFVGDITFLHNPDALKIWIDCKDVKTASLDNILIGNAAPQKWYKEEKKKMKKLEIDKPIVIIFKLFRKKEDYIYFRYNDFSYHVPRMKWKQSISYNGFQVLKLNRFLKIVDKGDIIDE